MIRITRRKILIQIRYRYERFSFMMAKILFRVFPLKDKIVFSNFNGQGYGDNPKYIADEILRQKLPYDLVWITDNVKSSLPSEIREVNIHSTHCVYDLSTAKVIVCNVKNGLPYIKRKGQYYIQTWHGGFPMKYIEKECESYLDPDYVAKSKKDSKLTDLILSSCSSDTQIFKKSFWYDGEILEKGIPRNDLLFKDNTELVKELKCSLHIDSDSKIALYAPTFRDNGDVDVYSLNTEELVKSLNGRNEGKWVVVVRLHPNVGRINKFSFSKNVVNGCNISDPQHLVVASDLLITDYSSMMYDFSIMKKPVFLYAPDLDDYKKGRGLRPLFFKLPFSLCLNNQELNEIIQRVDMKDYAHQSEWFFRQVVKSWDNGHASEIVVSRIKSVIDSTKIKKKNFLF